MYKCIRCNNLFEDGEQKQWEEPHPYGDTTVSEQVCGCPICLESFEEIKPCAICGDYPAREYEDGELSNGGICSYCFNDGIKEYFLEYFKTIEEKQQIDSLKEFIINSDSDRFGKWLISKSNGRN